MSLIARIQYVNFLTYSHPDSRDRKPALRVVEFSPLKYSTAINIPNGHGKTNMISALLYLVSRDSKLKQLALPLFTPRRCGAPSHIRVQLWDLQDDLVQADLGLDEGLIDPACLPNRNDHYVFGLCAYQSDEPKFYYYRGVLEDCPVFERTDNGYIYSQETEVQQAVKAVGGTWNISSVHEWRSLITSHIPSRVLAQQVKFHLDGGGDKSAQLHLVQPDGDESFDQAFFRTIIAPELLASTGELESDPEDPRENFEELLYAHFSKMASATIKAEQEKQLIQEQEDVVRELGGLVVAGEKARGEDDKYRLMLRNIFHDGALVQHFVCAAPFPGLLDGRHLPPGRVGEIVPYIVIDKIHGLMILDAGLEKLTSVETGVLNQAANRARIHHQEVDDSQVIDITCNLKIFGRSGWGGSRVARTGYILEAALDLVSRLRDIGTAKLAGAADTLQQAFGWIEKNADTNRYRKIACQLIEEIECHKEDIKRRGNEIAQWDAQIRELSGRISKYDQAKGAYEDLVKSRNFTAEELEVPALLTNKVTEELRAAEDALARHDKRVGRLEKVFTSYLAFCQNNPGVSVRDRLEKLTKQIDSAQKDLLVAKQRLQHSSDEFSRLNELKLAQETLNSKNQQQLGMLQELQSHQSLYTEWFGDTSPGTIDIRGGLKKINDDEKDLTQRRQEREGLRDNITLLLPSVPRFRELFEDANAERIDISGELQRIAIQEKELEKARNIADMLYTRIQSLNPFIEMFRRLFGDADPMTLDPSKDYVDLLQAITLTETAKKSLDTQVSRLNLFRDTYPEQNAAAWLVDMQSRRTGLMQKMAELNLQILTAERQLDELMSDPVARPEDVARAHILIDGVIPFVPLHAFIENHCSFGVKQQWLTHFSALLFAPVVETIRDAAEAAHLLYDGQATMPVLIASPLKTLIENGTPTFAMEDECAYTWLAGIKTRMVHCLLNPAAVKEERSLAQQRLVGLQEMLFRKQNEFNEISEKSVSVLLALDAERADSSGAERELAAVSERLAQLRKQLPSILARSSSEALDCIQKMREYLNLIREYGENVSEEIVEELRLVGEKIELLRQTREWYEERNSDDVRKVIMDMRKYRAFLTKHGTDVLQKIETDLGLIEEEAEDLRRWREWYEKRDRDDIHIAVSSMRRYLQVGGDTELTQIQNVVNVGMANLCELATKIAAATQAVTEDEEYLSVARTVESNAITAYDQNSRYLEELAHFSENEDFLFMETHELSRQALEVDKYCTEARKRYESQFSHAQRYIDETRNQQTSEQELLNRKAGLEAKSIEARRLQEKDGQAVDDKNGKLIALKSLQDVLHETACRLLAEFRAVSKNLEDIRDTENVGVPLFESSDLYQHAESIRNRLERSESDPFLLDEVRKLGRLAGELGLASQAKEIEQARRHADRMVREYRERKAIFCTEIINGAKKGLSALNGEWLQSQERFDAPSEMKAQIEASIASNSALLQQATTSLEFARDKTTEMLTILAKDAERALSILDEAMATTPTARFYVKANIIAEERIGNLLDRLYSDIETQMRRHTDSGWQTGEKRQKRRALDELRVEVYRSLFTDVNVEFRHPSIWDGGQHRVTSKSLSEGMRTAISLMWIAKLAEFRLRQAIDQAGGMRRQNSRAALRKERYFMILDGLFSNLSHDNMIDSAMESLRLSAGHFQLIGMIHHPRYINNPKIFPSYFVGRPYRASGGKHAWLTVDQHNNPSGSLGIFGSHFTK